LWSNIVSKSTGWCFVEVVVTSPLSNKSEQKSDCGVVSSIGGSEGAKDLGKEVNVSNKDGVADEANV